MDWCLDYGPEDLCFDDEPVDCHFDDDMVCCLMVFNATFSNISFILWRSVLLVEEAGGPRENH